MISTIVGNENFDSKRERLKPKMSNKSVISEKSLGTIIEGKLFS